MPNSVFRESGGPGGQSDGVRGFIYPLCRAASTPPRLIGNFPDELKVVDSSDVYISLEMAKSIFISAVLR